MAAAFVTSCAAFFKRGRTTTVIATLTTAATIAAAIFAATEAIIEILRAVVVHGQRVGRVVGKVQFIAAPRQLHQLVAQIMVIIRRAVNGFRDALAVGIVGIRPRLPRRLIVLANKLVEAVVGIGRRALAVEDGRDVPARCPSAGRDCRCLD